VRKYAVDLLTTDRIIHPSTGRVIVIDFIEPGDNDKLKVSAYFEDDGTPWDVSLDFDNEMVVA
jgi:hypothetical protein